MRLADRQVVILALRALATSRSAGRDRSGQSLLRVSSADLRASPLARSMQRRISFVERQSEPKRTSERLHLCGKRPARPHRSHAHVRSGGCTSPSECRAERGANAERRVRRAPVRPAPKRSRTNTFRVPRPAAAEGRGVPNRREARRCSRRYWSGCAAADGRAGEVCQPGGGSCDVQEQEGRRGDAKHPLRASWSVQRKPLVGD